MPKNTKIFLIVIAIVAAFLFGTLFSQAPKQNITPNMSQNAMQTPPNTSESPANPNFAANNNELAHVQELEAQALKEPNNAKLFADIGNHYYDQHLSKEAIEAYKKAIALDPSNPDVLTDLGTMYRLEKDFPNAIAMYSQAIEKNPAHKNARFNLGLVYLIDLNEIDKGVEAWQTLYSLYPDEQINGTDLDLFVLETLEKQAIKYTEQSNIDLAVQYYNAILSINPRDQIILNDKATLLQKNNRIEEAKSAWLDLLKINPGASTLDGQPVENLEILQK